MKFPLSWLREFVALPSNITAAEVADALLRQGLEVESVSHLGEDLVGPVVVARVLTVEVLTEFKKPIRWVSVDAGEGEPRWMICGAENFAPGDLVVVVKPGATLPGGFTITARETYGHTSDGMICSSKELGLGEDHSGIVVLPEGSANLGDDAIALLGLQDSVVDLAVTPDRGYALSMRGIAREVATAFSLEFKDPVSKYSLSKIGTSIKADIADTTGADRLVLSSVSGWNPTAHSPLWMQTRLTLCGMRPISLAVDVTNYVMLELGQPLHAFDAQKVHGTLRVRRAASGEKLETLDHVKRPLISDDLVIADDQGPLALAGTMGGLESEISDSTSSILLEAAHFFPATVGRMSRRHKLSSEASRRLERGVDHDLQPAASARAIALLCEFGGGVHDTSIDVDNRTLQSPIIFDPHYASRLVGYSYSVESVESHLRSVGCEISKSEEWEITPPSWRPDLTIAEDLVEEVARLEGYEKIPSVMLTQSSSRGLTDVQRARRNIGRTLAGHDFVEVLNYPFHGSEVLDSLGVVKMDSRRNLIALINPISEEESFLRSTLLPGLFATLKRNLGRGAKQVALFEMGSLFFAEGFRQAPTIGVHKAPSSEELTALMGSIPRQPQSVAGVLAGARESEGWQGKSTPSSWSDAVAAARAVVESLGASVEVRSAEMAPWHPGRGAAIYADGDLVGYAGEIHPRVLKNLELPARTSAFEIDLDRLGVARSVHAPIFSIQPPAIQDIALIVAETVATGEVVQALIAGGGPELERVDLFDRYAGEPIPDGSVSLAFTLTFRAHDRTLTGDEVAMMRSAAVSEAISRCGATLRG